MQIIVRGQTAGQGLRHQACKTMVGLLYFDSWVREAAGCQQRLLILELMGTGLITALPFPVRCTLGGHTIHLLLPLGVGSFTPP